MKVMLGGADLFDIVDGTEPPPPDAASAARKAAYQKRSNLAVSYIWNSLTTGTQKVVANDLKNPHSIWETL